MKKLLNLTGLGLFFIFGLFSLSFSEDVTITTYYPSPYGNYNELTASTLSASTNTYLAYQAVANRVGIGTTSPQAKLDVIGDSRFVGNAVINGNTTINGNVTVTGSISGGGVKTAIVPTLKGNRKLYVLEAADCRFEDFGSAKLVDGRAEVKLDSLFLQTVTITNKYPLIVSITLTSDSPGVYVEKKAAGSFIVKEIQGGKGNAAFDYRVTAMRKGFENIRMELFSNEENQHL